MELNWTKNKPTEPGAYWVRGWSLDAGHEQDLAVVTVTEIDGELCSDVNECNTAWWRDWLPIENHSDRFEWCGPLVPAN